MKKVKINQRNQRFLFKSPVYERIGACDHQFQAGQYYSLRSLSLILGVSENGVRQRSIIDEWDVLPVWKESKRILRPTFVDGGFLKALQQTVRGGDAS